MITYSFTGKDGSYLNSNDFEFSYEDNGDYWFKVYGKSQKTLTKEYMEQSMVDVTGVVYGTSDKAYGVVRLFPFNHDVVQAKDDNLKELLEWLVYQDPRFDFEARKQHNER